MVLNNKDAAVRANSINAQTGPGADEIDLYDELNAFAALSPEEQLRLVAPPEKMSAETGKTATESAEELTPPEPVLTHAAIEPVEEAAPEPAAEAASEPEDSEVPVRSSLVRPELYEWPRPLERVEAEATVPAAESACDSEVSKAYVEPGEVRPPLVEGPRPSDPLSGFNLTPDFVFTGALSRGVCVACGAESGADDLFCITCGVFIDEIASTLPFNPTCGECKQGIKADEIFCPWCGSVLPAA
jgi:hypothetical protein